MAGDGSSYQMDGLQVLSIQYRVMNMILLRSVTNDSLLSQMEYMVLYQWSIPVEVLLRKDIM